MMPAWNEDSRETIEKTTVARVQSNGSLDFNLLSTKLLLPLLSIRSRMDVVGVQHGQKGFKQERDVD